MCRRHALNQAISLTVLAMGASSAALAQYEVPDPQWSRDAFYTGVNPASATLKADLNDLIDGNTVSPYDNSNHTADAVSRLMVLDADPNNSNNVLLVYSGFSIPKTWNPNSNDGWNREHLWCNSYGLDSSGSGYGDLFNLRPANPNVNSTRNDRYYDYATGLLPNSNPNTLVRDHAPECRMDDPATPAGNPGSWQPRAAERGDIARSLFYMDTRFEGDLASDGEADNLTLTDDISLINNNAAYMGKLSTLLQWNYQDGITNAERKRNHQVDTLFQHNRNPFIDHPEYVWKVFGLQAGQGNNSSKIYVGASEPSNGASGITASLRVMKNGAFGTTAVTLTKSGVTPTTLDITTGGSAVTADAGVGQTFDYNAQSRAITVGLNASTATTGLKTGTVTIDNTDLTTLGAGQGSADGNDVITVNGQVVDNRTITASSGNFGRVIIGSNVSTGTTLTSPGSDDSNTRVTVKAAASAADSNGVSIAAGADTTFNGTLTTAGRTVQGNFATPGAKSGSRSFTVQGEGLTGETVNGVSVSYSATALDHAKPSLDSSSTQTSQSVSFGYVPAGFAARTATFNVYNNAAPAGAAFTAGLDIDGSTNGSAQMTTNVVATSPGSPLAAGASPLAYTATYTPTTGGIADATSTIATSDENIPGAAAAATLSINATGYTLTAATFPTTGFMNLFAGETYNTGAFAIQTGVTLSFNGVGTMNVTGAQNNGAGSGLVVSNGHVNLNTDAGSAASPQLALEVSGTGAVGLGATQHLASLTVETGASAAVAPGGNKVIATNSLSVTGTGKLDLSDNKLIVRNTAPGSWTGTSYTSTAGLIASGRNGGSWNGSGIVISQSAATSGSLTTIGIASASEVKGISATDTATWAGEIVGGTDTLVMYTYGGDANLDGKINVDDYTRIDFNVTLGSTGWYNGDFNYDGKINVDDYTMIDFNVGIQGAPFNASAGSLSQVVAVPEPASIAGMALAGGLLLRRRRRH